MTQAERIRLRGLPLPEALRRLGGEGIRVRIVETGTAPDRERRTPRVLDARDGTLYVGWFQDRDPEAAGDE